MNSSKNTQFAMMALMLFSYWCNLTVFAQEATTERSVFEKLKAGEIVIERSLEPLTLSAAANPFGNLQFRLVSVSQDDFGKLNNLIPDKTKAAQEADVSVSRAKNYSITKRLAEGLDRRLKSLVKSLDAELFHSYRIARRDSDFLFGKLPAVGGKVDESKFVAALKFETDRTRNGQRKLAGQIRFKDAPEEPVDVEFFLQSSQTDESPVGHMVAIPHEDRMFLLTLGRTQPTPNSGSEVVSKGTAARQRQPSTSDQSAIERLQPDVGFFEANRAEFEAVAKLVGQPIQLEGDVAVLQLSAEQVGNLPKANMEMQTWNQLPKRTRGDNKSTWSFRPRRKSGQDRWNVKPVTATVQIEPSADAEKVGKVTVEFSRDEDQIRKVQHRHSAELAKDTRVAFVATRKGEESFLVAAVAFENEMEAPSANAARSTPAAPSAPATSPSKPTYIVNACVYEMQEEALGNLRVALSIDEFDVSSCVISKSDANEFQDFAKERLEKGEASVLSRPTIRTIADEPAQIQIGSEVPILLHRKENSKIEFENVGLLLSTTLSPRSVNSDYLKWAFANTNQEGSAFVERRARGGSILEKGESILIFLPPQRTGGFSLVASLTPSKVTQVHTSPQSQDMLIQELTRKFNLAMKNKRFAEAIVFAKQARKIQPDDTTLAMLQKAKVPQQIASSVQSEPGSSAIDRKEASNAIEIVEGKSSNTEVRLGNTTRFSGFEGHVLTIVADDRIKAVTGFDSGVVKVDPVQGNPSAIELCMLSEGGTTISVVDEHGQRHQIKLLVKADDGGLSLYLGKLYPSLQIGVWPVKGAVLLRGKVPSSTQKRQIMALADCFFPTVLDQITIDNSIPNQPLPTEPTAEAPIDRERISINADTPSPLFLVKKCTCILQLPDVIRSVTGVVSECVEVGTVSGEGAAVQVTALDGMTELTFTCGDSSVHKVTIVVQDDVSHLTYLAHELYPNLNLNFIPINGSVVVRGCVFDQSQTDEIIELAEQYYAEVLNQLTIDGRPMAERASGAIRKNLNSTPVSTISVKSGSSGQIETVRSDIRALHSDVRDLVNLLKARDNTP